MLLLLLTVASFSELRHLNRAQDERRTQEDRWQTDVPSAGIFWVLLATTKLGTKSAFWVPRGLGMQGLDQGCRTAESLQALQCLRLGSVLSSVEQLQGPLRTKQDFQKMKRGLCFSFSVHLICFIYFVCIIYKGEKLNKLNFQSCVFEKALFLD